MNDAPIQPSNTTARAARPSIVESFKIEGLYGYRTISLESDYAATILIARNGTGKTTLLGALDAFLRLQFTRLRELEFSRITCSLRGIENDLVMTHDDLVEFLQIPTDHEFSRVAARTGLAAEVLFHYIVHDYPSMTREEIRSSDDKTTAALRSGFGFSLREQEATLEKIRVSLFSRQENINLIWSAVSAVLHDTEIVYLPTYRRVELALLDDAARSPYTRRQAPKFNVAAGSLYTGDIQFGLADISDRLSVLHNQIVNASNNGYRQISANIINDLIDGSFADQDIAPDALPTKDELGLFFSRLKENRRVSPLPTVDAPNLDKLYTTDAVPQASQKFLPYFLAQLGKVIDTAKAVEAPVDAFIDSCNKYLQSDEPSTELSAEEKLDISRDSKTLRLNRRNLSVYVESAVQGRRISLNALSSGEKQMISLFAKLFLYPKKKLVLIDEPELSLSIDWQATILVDVLNAPLCEQVIAITHSPFVFENELDPFARAVTIKTYIPEEAELTLDDGATTDFDDVE